MDDLTSAFLNVGVREGISEYEELKNILFYIGKTDSVDYAKILYIICNKLEYYYKEINFDPDIYENEFKDYVYQIRELFGIFFSTPHIKVNEKIFISERIFSRMFFIVQRYYNI